MIAASAFADRMPTAPQLLAYLDSSAAMCASLPCALPELLAKIEDIWLPHRAGDVHLELHRANDARAVVVLLPGSGSYARFYCVLGAHLAKLGYHVLGVDRPGHGYSKGERGDCTIADSLDVTAAAIDYARASFSLPVVLLGSSLGGFLTGYALLAGIRPDLAIAHNFLIPGRLISLRLRAWYIEHCRRGKYPLAELANRFKGLSDDPALRAYLAAQADPYAAWELSRRSVASLFRHNPRRPVGDNAPLVLLNSTRDRVVPAAASRFFLWLSGLRHVEYRAVEGAGHMLFHDHLLQTLPLLTNLIERVAQAPATAPENG